MPNWLTKYDESIQYNTKKFTDIDRKIKQHKINFDEVRKEIKKKVFETKYKEDKKIIDHKFTECISYHHLQKHKDYVNP